MVKQKVYLRLLQAAMLPLMLLTTATAWAKPVSKKEAQQTAQAFMRQQMNILGVRKAPQKVDMKDALDSHDNEYLYVFNAPDGKGFVIVSGDDRTEPVLGYSTSGSFDASRMPDNMRSWLQHYAEQIALMQKYDLPASQESVSDLGEPIPPQLKSNWLQSGVFNQTCPKITVYSDPECTQLYEYTDDYGNKTSIGRAATGCSAIALAQVLNYWKAAPATLIDLPAKENVVVRKTDNKTGTPVWLKYSDAAIPAGTPIDWDNILDQYLVYDEEAGQYTWIMERDKMKAVADLCHICGVASDIQYGLSITGGSDAQSQSCFIAVNKCFGFKNVSACMQEFYSYQEWLQTLYEELTVARAVFFGSNTPGGSGHAFVIDGYDKEDLFHVNWGWGVFDGYFRINELNPQDKPTGGYVTGQIFAQGIYPGAPVVAPALLSVKCETPVTTLKNVGGLFTLPELSVKVYSIRQAVTNAEIGLTIENQGEKTTLQTDGIIHEVLFKKYTNLQLTDIPLGQLVDGEYLCYPSFRTSGSEEWTPCTEYEQTGMKLTVKGGTIAIENVLRYKMDVLSSDNKSVYAPGEPIQFTATLQMQKGELHNRIVPLCQPLASFGNPDEGQSCGLSPMTYVNEGETFQVDFNVSGGLTEGTYTFSLLNDTYNSFHPVCTITVKSNPTGISPNVQCSPPLLSHEGEDNGASPRAGLDGGIYDLSGRLVNLSTRQLVNSLKKGIYINNGKKILK